jgi:hypothetical protein
VTIGARSLRVENTGTTFDAADDRRLQPSRGGRGGRAVVPRNHGVLPGDVQPRGIPTYIKRDVELAPYVDWNRDPGNQRYFERDICFRGPSVRTTFTRDEAALINRVCDQVVAITGQAGRAARPVCNPLAQMGLFRSAGARRRLKGRHRAVARAYCRTNRPPRRQVCRKGTPPQHRTRSCLGHAARRDLHCATFGL